MSRPKFPTPYTPLTPGMISRIRSNQAHYDKDPEAAERQQRYAEEQRLLDQEQERQAEQQAYEEGRY